MVDLGKSVVKDMHAGAKPELFRYAQAMRKNPTAGEKALWNILRKFRYKGYIFRRQHPVDIFIADFYCHKLKLIIEVDGGVHNSDQAIEYDDGRSGELEKYGLKIIRFTNDEVLNETDKVIFQIQDYINRLTSPSPAGEGDQRG
jgi:very-short-patch-repair endonuclease